jgi:hypothetical protein
MWQLKIFLIAWLVLSGLLAGCATLFNSGSQVVSVTMDPLPAHPEIQAVAIEVATADGTYRATAPTNIVSTPSTSRNLTIRIIERCFQEDMTVVNRTVTASYWANIFNFWGFLIDPLTGAMWRLDNRVQLHPTPKPDFAACRATH